MHFKKGCIIMCSWWKTFLSFSEVDQIALHLHLDECSLQINHFAGCMLAMRRSVKPLSCAQKTSLVALRAFETLAPLSERCIVHILHRAAHIPWALLWDVAFKAGQCSARLWHCPKSWKGICGIFQILPQCSVCFDSQGEGGDNQGGRSWQVFGESKKCL